MINLAGNDKCDSYICEELMVAGIPICGEDAKRSEVPYTIRGELWGWVFRRAWYYWTASPTEKVNGLPLEFANPLYVGYGEFARAGGDCACRSPDTWSNCYDADGQHIVLDPEGEQQQTLINMKLASKNLRFVASMDEVPDRIEVVTSYHIDSVLGLKAFANTLKEWKKSTPCV